MTVIRVDQTALEGAKQLAIKQWLAHAGLSNVEIHVRGKIAEQMALAATKSLAADGKPNMEISANEHIAAARRLETFLEVLQSIQGEKQFFVTKLVTDKE